MGCVALLRNMKQRGLPIEKAAKRSRTKEGSFTEDQIWAMSERDAWTWIFAHDQKTREMKLQSKLPQICFTGFSDSKKEELREIAKQAGFEAKDSVTKTLVIPVVGENAGPSKIAKPQIQGCIVTDEAGFMDTSTT